MSQSQPAGLPSFYSERPKDRNAIPRGSEDDDEALLRSNEPQPPDEVRLGKERRDVSTIGPLAFETPDTPVRRSNSHRRNNEVARWAPPSREYGRYWDDRRSYANAYRPPYYQDEFEDSDYELRSRPLYRQSAPPPRSRYGSVRGPPIPSRHYSRLPPKQERYYEDDSPGEEYPEDYGPDPRAGNAGRYGGRPPPPPPPRDRDASSIMRLPWALWMGSNAKNRKIHHALLDVAQS